MRSIAETCKSNPDYTTTKSSINYVTKPVNFGNLYWAHNTHATNVLCNFIRWIHQLWMFTLHIELCACRNQSQCTRFIKRLQSSMYPTEQRGLNFTWQGLERFPQGCTGRFFVFDSYPAFSHKVYYCQQFLMSKHQFLSTQHINSKHFINLQSDNCIEKLMSLLILTNTVGKQVFIVFFDYFLLKRSFSSNVANRYHAKPRT